MSVRPFRRGARGALWLAATSALLAVVDSDDGQPCPGWKQEYWAFGTSNQECPNNLPSFNTPPYEVRCLNHKLDFDGGEFQLPAEKQQYATP